MVKGNGVLNIDSVQLGEATINVLGAQKALTGKFALMNSVTGSRFGATTLDAWSEVTLQKFQELIESMESDMITHLFSNGQSSPGGEEFPPVLEDAVPGL